MNCGECLMSFCEVVKLKAGICPNCGSDYTGTVLQSPSGGTMPQALSHFLSLTLQGKHRGCSSGEKAARDLAKAIAKNAPLLDSSALRGASLLVELSGVSPGTARMLCNLT